MVAHIPPEFIPDDLSSEAATIIAKHKSLRFRNTILFHELGADLINYVDRPALLYEIFTQVFVLHGGQPPVQLVSFFFTSAIYPHQIRQLSESYMGRKLLDWIASLLINVNQAMIENLRRNGRGNHLIAQQIKIMGSYLLCKAPGDKPHAGEIVPNNTGVSDRFGKGHDGIHIRAPRDGGQVKTIKALSGDVIRVYLQEAQPIRMYGIWVLTKTGVVAVYKDLLEVNPRLRKLSIGNLYLSRGNRPTSRIFTKEGEIIAKTRGWDGDVNKKDIGLHLSFVQLKHIREFKDNLQNKKTSPLKILITPCGDSSPVRCI